jgi:hypothetical protein
MHTGAHANARALARNRDARTRTMTRHERTVTNVRARAHELVRACARAHTRRRAHWRKMPLLCTRSQICPALECCITFYPSPTQNIPYGIKASVCMCVQMRVCSRSRARAIHTEAGPTLSFPFVFSLGVFWRLSPPSLTPLHALSRFGERGRRAKEVISLSHSLTCSLLRPVSPKRERSALRACK